MEEIRAIPWNGLKVASTFSGCGGSCLGYRMAGYRVVWANEFDKHARKSYRLNHDSTLDARDIRKVQAGDILKATGLDVGELDVFDGSPPCQGFSTAGKRKVMDRRNNLFHEYARLVKGLQPRAFIAENVSGMVKGTMKGVFLEVLKELKGCGYRVKCRVLDAQWLGVPQMRKRAIFIGIREDIGKEPQFPKPLLYQYSVRDALPWITKVSCNVNFEQRMRTIALPSPTISTSGPSDNQSGLIEAEDLKPCRSVTSDDSFGSRGIVKRKFTINELKRICAFPDGFQLSGSYAEQWKRLGNSVPPLMMKAIATKLEESLDRHSEVKDG